MTGFEVSRDCRLSVGSKFDAAKCAAGIDLRCWFWFRFLPAILQFVIPQQIGHASRWTECLNP